MVRRPVQVIGQYLLEGLASLQGLGAFALITLGVIFTKANTAREVMKPLIRRQIFRGGICMLPTVLFLSLALGLVVIGQAVSLLTRVGAQDLLGTIMVTVIVRELGPLVAALLVLNRIGTSTVIELGTARALGEVETLEALRIDPIHLLVVPRVFGMLLGVFSLTIYLILLSLISGYFFAFIQDVPLLPGQYVRQIAGALQYTDFILLTFKTCGFGLIIAVCTCYQGLAQPLTLDDVSGAANRAVSHSVIGCVLLDALFLVAYLLT
jgi:phospholipid/cholesterol/gamma-HCH transport system permease protein